MFQCLRKILLRLYEENIFTKFENFTCGTRFQYHNVRRRGPLETWNPNFCLQILWLFSLHLRYMWLASLLSLSLLFCRRRSHANGPGGRFKRKINFPKSHYRSSLCSPKKQHRVLLNVRDKSKGLVILEAYMGSWSCLKLRYPKQREKEQVL